jgi:hypothetical protein
MRVYHKVLIKGHCEKNSEVKTMVLNKEDVKKIKELIREEFEKLWKQKQDLMLREYRSIVSE